MRPTSLVISPLSLPSYYTLRKRQSKVNNQSQWDNNRIMINCLFWQPWRKNCLVLKRAHTHIKPIFLWMFCMQCATQCIAINSLGPYVWHNWAQNVITDDPILSPSPFRRLEVPETLYCEPLFCLFLPQCDAYLDSKYWSSFKKLGTTT